MNETKTVVLAKPGFVEKARSELAKLGLNDVKVIDVMEVSREQID